MIEAPGDPVAFSLDGAPANVVCDARTPALGVFREVLGTHALKGGCDPQGMCGCCAILVDGRPRLACTLPMRGVRGAVVQTAAGLEGTVRAALAECFAEAGASQCGYCTPGIVVSAAALLARESTPDDAAIDRALALHLCRCTGYAPIVQAIRAAAARLRGETGVDAGGFPDETADLATGERAFVEDLVRPGMLHGVVVLAEEAGPAAGVPACGDDGLVAVALVTPGEDVGAGQPLVAVAHASPERAREAAVRLQGAIAQVRAGAVEVGRATHGAEGVPPSRSPLGGDLRGRGPVLAAPGAAPPSADASSPRSPLEAPDGANRGSVPSVTPPPKPSRAGP